MMSSELTMKDLLGQSFVDVIAGEDERSILAASC